jgi:hypothetical protein
MRGISRQTQEISECVALCFKTFIDDRTQTQLQHVGT